MELPAMGIYSHSLPDANAFCAELGDYQK